MVRAAGIEPGLTNFAFCRKYVFYRRVYLVKTAFSKSVPMSTKRRIPKPCEVFVS